jgi:hypothetical protein
VRGQRRPEAACPGAAGAALNKEGKSEHEQPAAGARGGLQQRRPPEWCAAGPVRGETSCRAVIA